MNISSASSLPLAELAKKPLHLNGSAGKIRVLVVDDHPAIQEALKITLCNETELVLCGVAKSAEEALRIAADTAPDVAVVDISLKDADGLDLVRHLRMQQPCLRVVIFSMYDESAYAERAIRAGALGYVMKSESTQSIIEAIRWVAQGDVYLSHRMTSRILNNIILGKRPNLTPGVNVLTDREMAVFRMLGQGYNLRSVAKKLNMSYKSAGICRRQIREKLGYTTVEEVLRYAILWTQKHS